MVQIVENWADVEGVVRRVTEQDERTALEITVDAARDVGSYPNLLAVDVGRRITVILAEEPDRRARPGDRVRCRVRKASLDRYYGYAPSALAPP